MYQWNDFGGLSRKLMSQLFVVGNQVCYVHVAIELLHNGVFTDLITAVMRI